jgi:hypothetical protein
VTTFSWQKVMGGEAAHGMLILSPRAVERLESYTPAWPLPKIFRLTKGGKLIEGIFVGETINTPSMLAVEDYLLALDWAQSIGGLARELMARADRQCAGVFDFCARRDWIDNLAADPATRSNTSVCLKFTDPGSPMARPLPRPWPSGWRPRAWRWTSAPIAMRRRVCASGAGLRWRPRISRRCCRGSTGPFRPRSRRRQKPPEG